MKCLRGNARGYDERIVPLQSGLAFAPHRCRDQLPKRPVMQSHGITFSFHREMTDSSRELVRLDGSAAVTLESYPRFIKGGFQDYEGLGIKRSTADSKHVPSVRSRLPGNNVFWSLLQKVVEFLELPGAWVSCPTLTRCLTLHSVPCLEMEP